MPVDRCPKAARERMAKSARGDRISPSLLRHAVRNGALSQSETAAFIVVVSGKSKALKILLMNQRVSRGVFLPSPAELG